MFILKYKEVDALCYHTNNYGTSKLSGKNYIKYSRGKVKYKSEYKKGKKHKMWFWYNKLGKALKKQVWDEGKLIPEDVLCNTCNVGWFYY